MYFLGFSFFFLLFFGFFCKFIKNTGQKLGSNTSDEDVDGGVDDDSGVFILLNTGDLCTRLCGSFAGNIGPPTNLALYLCTSPFAFFFVL